MHRKPQKMYISQKRIQETCVLLPLLPEAAGSICCEDKDFHEDAYTAKQMLEYAEKAQQVEQERCAKQAIAWGDTHEPHETVNALNAASKIARAIKDTGARL